ncbi:MAG: hypothetical protein M0R02_05745 [Bacteroidales bacterium]|jgi:hypothetical protein|nr:hypothetical protein [Bacteroidales bacterium]NLK80894.1 hypothetical protein [Bacteroidales bacterium]
MKKIGLILFFGLFFATSCTYYVADVVDGESFFKVNWNVREPSFVDPGAVIPNSFRWDTYYRTYPGTYFFYYEYDYRSNRGVVVYPYEIEIEVWNERASRNHDGNNVYFELVLFPDGYFDYFHDIEHKSKNLLHKQNTVTSRTFLGEKVEIKNGVGVKYSLYQLPVRHKE